jgi:hypothetical protein
MSTNDGAINEQVLEVWISGAKLMQLLEDAGFSPTGEAFIDGIPIAVFFGQQSPLRTAARNPEDRGEEATALPLRADVNLTARAKEGQKLLPLLIGECYW